jgi:hypothetical protein
MLPIPQLIFECKAVTFLSSRIPGRIEAGLSAGVKIGLSNNLCQPSLRNFARLGKFDQKVGQLPRSGTPLIL